MLGNPGDTTTTTTTCCNVHFVTFTPTSPLPSLLFLQFTTIISNPPQRYVRIRWNVQTMPQIILSLFIIISRLYPSNGSFFPWPDPAYSWVHTDHLSNPVMWTSNPVSLHCLLVPYPFTPRPYCSHSVVSSNFNGQDVIVHFLKICHQWIT